MGRFITVIWTAAAIGLGAAAAEAQPRGPAVVEMIAGAIAEPSGLAEGDSVQLGRVIRMEPGTLLVLRYSFPDPAGEGPCEVFEFAHRQSALTVGDQPGIWGCVASVDFDQLDRLQGEGRPFVEYLALIDGVEVGAVRRIAALPDVKAGEDADKANVLLGLATKREDLNQLKRRMERRAAAAADARAVASSNAVAVCFDHALKGGQGAPAGPAAFLDKNELQQLCGRGAALRFAARRPAAPARCYNAIARNESQLGGLWRPMDIIAVCARSQSADATLKCVEQAHRKGGGTAHMVKVCAKP